MKKIAIYFAGSIAKGHETSATKWTDEDIQILRKHMSPLELVMLNPATRTDDLTDMQSIFGRDMMQVSISDLIFVDARDRRGLGVGAEMMWAKMLAKPILTWAPLGTHYHRENGQILDTPVPRYVHPFVESLSDQLVSSVEEGAEWIQKWASGTVTNIKDRHVIHESIKHYRETQFEHDIPMRELVASSGDLADRLL